jgi:hypothetical protein
MNDSMTALDPNAGAVVYLLEVFISAVLSQPPSVDRLLLIVVV